jgi:hypothetical protein
VPMRVLLVALENGQGCHEISFLQEVRDIWQFIFLLLINYE